MTANSDRSPARPPSGGPALRGARRRGRPLHRCAPTLCVIAENAEGLCRARGVRGRPPGQPHLRRGRPASSATRSRRSRCSTSIPGTRALSLGCYGCNVLCIGCQNWQISHANARNETARLSELSPADAVALAKRHKLSGVAFTYNDPVVWIEYVHDVCAAFKDAGLYTAFITAGYITRRPSTTWARYVEAFKFDLKAADAEGWARLTKVKDPAPALGRGRSRPGEARLPRGGGVQPGARHQR